jgi:hypothetical protein
VAVSEAKAEWGVAIKLPMYNFHPFGLDDRVRVELLDVLEHWITDAAIPKTLEEQLSSLCEWLPIPNLRSINLGVRGDGMDEVGPSWKI